MEAESQREEEVKKRKEKVYDNSMITEYQGCHRRAKNHYIDHWVSKEKNPTLWFGSTYHRCIECLLPPKNGTGADVEKIIQTYKPPQTEGLRTQDKLRKLVQLYMREKMPIRWDRVIALEEAISFPIGEFTFVVNPDTVIEWRNGGIYGWERKHTQNLSRFYFEKFDMDSQIDAQMLGIRHKYGKCNGILVEAGIIRKGGPRSKLPEVEIITGIPFSRTPEELKEAEEYFHYWMDRMENDTRFEKNKTNCYAYGRRCEFKDVCLNKIGKMEDHFNREVWDPQNREV